MSIAPISLELHRKRSQERANELGPDQGHAQVFRLIDHPTFIRRMEEATEERKKHLVSQVLLRKVQAYHFSSAGRLELDGAYAEEGISIQQLRAEYARVFDGYVLYHIRSPEMYHGTFRVCVSYPLLMEDVVLIHPRSLSVSPDWAHVYRGLQALEYLNGNPNFPADPGTYFQSPYGGAPYRLPDALTSRL